MKKIPKWGILLPQRLIHKVILTMKIATLLVLLTTLNASAVLSQNDKLSLDIQDISLKEAFSIIENQSDYRFFFSDNYQDLNNIVTYYHSVDENIDNVLAQLLDNKAVTYKVLQNKVVVITPVTESKQGIRVSGTVVDATTNESLPGVNIMIEGTQTGVVSDMNGNYKIEVPSPDAVLVFSYIGYLTERITVTGQTVINVSLSPDVQTLEEVVVVGYGTQRKGNVTGSIASIKSKDFTAAPIANASNTLAGRLPGLVSLQTSGQPGSDAANLSIRGFGNALVIVDGIETSFTALDPNQVESISILKDASASIYGSRAGNGVILVTTKRGDMGKPKFTFSTSKTLQGITIMPKPVNAAQYAELAREYHLNSGQSEETAPFTLEQIEQYKNGELPSTDWYDELIRPWAPQQQHNISVRGGNDAIKYYGFLGYLEQETVFKKNGGDYKRYNFQSNIDARILDNLNMQLTVSSIIEDRNFPHISLSSGEASAWGYFWNTLPIYPAHLPDPTRISFADGNGTGGAHVISNRDIAGYNDKDDVNLRGSIALNYDFPFVKGLSAKVFANYHSFDIRNKVFAKPAAFYTYEPESQIYTKVGMWPGSNATLTQRDDRGRTLTGQFSLNFDRKFGDHNITALALYEVLDIKSDFMTAGRQNYVTPTLDWLYAGDPQTQSNDGKAYENSRVSYVGRLNYSYKDKYLLESIIRADATPIFPPGKRWGYFPSVSLGWRLSEEDFMSGISFIDDLKLRASYGQSGLDYANDNVYRFLAGYTYTNLTYLLGNSSQKGFVSTGLPNPNFTWYDVTTYNFGVDFAFLGRKLYGEADAFYREVTGILGMRSRSMPSTFGAILPMENLNSSNDRGFELKLGTAGKANDLQWDISGNISWSRAKWDQVDEPVYEDPDQERLSKRSGRWTDVQFGYLTDGLFTSEEEIANSTVIQDKNGNTTIRPGDIKIVDANNDSIIDWRDQVEIGKGTIPHWIVGFNASVTYKNFDLAALFQGAFGYNTYIAFSQGKVFPTFYYEERWTEDNNRADALIPRSGSSGGGYNLATTSMRYKSAGYVRLKSLSIGYNVPKKFLSKLNVDDLRIYVAGTNLLTFDKLKKYNIDPEAPSGTAGALSAHTGRYYPQQKTISLGATISF